MKFENSLYRKLLQPEIDRIQFPVREIEPHFEMAIHEIKKIPESKANYKYGDDKWTVSEILGHLIDTQMVWVFRILWICRGEKGNLMRADENLWNRTSGYNSSSIESVLNNYIKLSEATSAFIKTIPAMALESEGTVNEVSFTTDQAIATLIAHEKHHLRILKERYLS